MQKPFRQRPNPRFLLAGLCLSVLLMPCGAELLGSDIESSAAAAADQHQEWTRQVLHGRYADDGCAWAGRYAECNDLGPGAGRDQRHGREQERLRSELKTLLAKRREALLAGRFPDDQTTMRIDLLRQEISETASRPGRTAAGY